MSLQVLRPGLLMTVQDMGRHGHQHVGLCPGGAMDPLALTLAKISADEAVALHAGSDYRVLMIGFAPGHAYIGGLNPKLSVPRRAAPRAIVPEGSVAIANDQTVIYPYAISGGWSIIGRTPLTVFDAERQEPSLFAAGDRVRFKPISRAEFQKLIAQ